MSIYEELIGKTDISQEEIYKKIQNLMKRNPDLNKDIAAFFLAKDLGIEIDDSKLVITPLNLLEENTKNANILVSIDRIFAKKDFAKEDRKGTVQNLIVTDNTAHLQLSLWNYPGTLNQEEVILVTNIYVNTFKGEKKLNTSKFSTIKVKTEVERKYVEKKLYELQDREYNLSVTGILKSKSEIKEFERDGQNKFVLRFVLTEDGFQNNCVAWGKIGQEVDKIEDNTKIKIKNCYSKLNRGQLELHLNDFTKIEILEKNAQEYVAPKKKISEMGYNEIYEINAKIKEVLLTRYNKICKVCNSPMIKVEDKYFCSICNSEQQSFAKANVVLIIEDDSGVTNAFLTKKILIQLLNCNEDDLESKLNTENLQNLDIHVIGYLRKNRNDESEFFVNSLI